MHARQIVGLMLEDCLSCLHEKQGEAVRAGVTAAIRGGRLSLSGLANRIEGAVALRHRIKRMDRLLGNAAIHGKRAQIYGALAARWLEGVDNLLIVIDWSDVTADQRWQLLRASVAVEGRSITLYEEVHPQKRLGAPWAHQRFLARLGRLLPLGCHPIIMTDAGFRSTWFELVSRRHWEWIGRIRNRDMVSVDGGPWRRATELYDLADTHPREFPDLLHVRSRPARRRMVLVKRSKKGRTSLTRFGHRRRSNHSLKAARRESEPWLLACSPGLAHLSPSAIVALYQQRMRIEQSFRDTKNARLGLGLSDARSRSSARYEVLLLIAHLAAWLLRLIGEGAQRLQLHLQFQSTCRSDRKEISVVTLAHRVMQAGTEWLTRGRLRDAIERLRQQAAHACFVC